MNRMNRYPLTRRDNVVQQSKPRRSFIRRTARISVVAVIGASLLAGCSYLGGGQAQDGKTHLQVLVHQNPTTVTALKDVAAAYKKQTGVDVEVTGVPLSDFSTVRNSRISGGKVDITEGIDSGGASPNPSWVGSDIPQKDWIKEVAAGNWVDLTGDKMLSNYSPGVLDQLRTNGKDYLVPTGLSYVTGMLYNKDLFTKYNLQIPTTWTEFVDVCQKLKGAGVIPIGIGGKTQWPAGLPVLGLVQSLFPDMQGLDKGLWDGSFKFTSPQSVELLDKLKTYYSYADPNFAGIDYSTIPGSFASAKFAMTADGNWTAPALESANPDFKFGVFPFPGSNDPSMNKLIGGKLDSSYGIPKSSLNQTEAKKFLAFYSDPANYTKFVKVSGLAPAQPNIGTTPFLKEISAFAGDGGFTPSWDQVWHANPKADPSLGLGWAYTLLSPMGTDNDPNSVATNMEQNWTKALP